MAISPPSDLVLDVVRAADPSEVQEAQARLKANQAAFRASSLAETGNGFANTVAVLNQSEGSSGLGDINNRAEPVKIPETYRKLEAMVLQDFVKSMLPAESEEVYGKGTAGEMWKGMMADQVANVMSQGQGVGIAKSLITDRIVGSENIDRVNASLDGNDNNVALSMVQEYQRKAVDQFMGTEDRKDRA
jgi:flagellar protein FlgJ